MFLFGSSAVPDEQRIRAAYAQVREAMNASAFSGTMPTDQHLYAELIATTRRAIDACVYGGSGYTYGAISTEAREKSFELMEQWLTPKQREQYQDKHWFDVQGSEGGSYRIYSDRTSFNVRRLEKKFFFGEKTSAEWLCFQPDGTTAQGDVMLAQKIMLEQDEPQALRIANRYHGVASR